MKIFITVCLLVLSLSFNADAEQKKQLGNWDVHYIAFPAPLLTPEIAQQYKLQRSKYNGVINISVLDTESKQAQQVTISGIAKDLQGRQRTLEFTEVTEGSAVYYLAQLPFRDEQRFTFTISISNSSETQQLMFDQTFYVD
ncbi:DUF4426 domain-containing protein [Rheinheimera baltica]|uniref:DUF4426 domain-containing protein n=1 Tax=Rheinheimera baltica TaxID=67576 RepID=UPI00273D529B|nr:DUF4426 domain-containing protein [Rheinheimera baltica]MDP5148592.1 DUF4426 domain-containing protein [Rheinheimera baltica]